MEEDGALSLVRLLHRCCREPAVDTEESERQEAGLLPRLAAPLPEESSSDVGGLSGKSVPTDD